MKGCMTSYMIYFMNELINMMNFMRGGGSVVLTIVIFISVNKIFFFSASFSLHFLELE